MTTSGKMIKRLVRLTPVLLVWLGSACHRTAPSSEADASSARTVVVRVPSALRVARGLGTLSVEIDPASRADTDVRVDPGTSLGVEWSTEVLAPGGAGPEAHGERRGLSSRPDFSVETSTWNVGQDDIPRPDRRYVVEMTWTMFETDVAPGEHWDPHAGQHFKVLLTRTIRQSEE